MLEGGEFLFRGGFGGLVARDVDVDYAARVDVRGKEDGGEFDLVLEELWLTAGA